MPGFLITTVGLGAYTAAGGMGPLVDITRFRVGPNSEAEGYIPALSDTDIPTPFTTGYDLPTDGYMPIVNYQIISDSEVAYTLRMDQSIGTFDFGSMALYQETAPLTYVCVAVYAFPSRIKKQILTMIDAGNVIEVTATLTLTNISTLSISILPVSVVNANIQVINSPDVLPTPALAPVNAYVINGTGSPYGLDTDGNSILAYKNDNTYWTFSTHLHEIYTTGLVDSSTTTQLTDLSLNNTLVSGFALGMYILVFTNNGYEGVVRMVTAVGTDTLDWFSPMTAPPVGTTFKVYIANVNWGGSGSAGGDNVFATVVSTLGQTVFNTFPVVAEQAIMFFGSAFQPPSSYIVSDVFEITLSPDPGLPAGINVHFIARTLDYSTVIPGGIAGQALIKNSGTNGDYSWANVSAVPTPTSPAQDGYVLRHTTGTAFSWQQDRYYILVPAGAAGLSLPGGTTAQRVDDTFYGYRYNSDYRVLEGFSTPGNAADAYTQFDLFQASMNHPRVSMFNDEFLGANSGWIQQTSGSATAAAIQSEVDHPGIYSIATGTTATDWVSWNRGFVGSTAGVIAKKQSRYLRYVLRLPSITDVKLTIGLGVYGSMANEFLDTDEGVGIIFDPASSSQFRGYVRDGAAGFVGGAPVNTGIVAVAGDWFQLEMRIDLFTSGPNTSALYFRVNAGSWARVSIPVALEDTIMTPAIRVETTTASSKSVELDSFCMYTTELGQRYT